MFIKRQYRTSIIKGDVNDERVKSAINEYIHTGSAHQANNIETFNNYVDLLKTEEGKKRLLIAVSYTHLTLPTID